MSTPLARLLAMAYRLLIDDLRRELETVLRAAHGGALPPVRPTV